MLSSRGRFYPGGDIVGGVITRFDDEEMRDAVISAVAVFVAVGIRVSL